MLQASDAMKTALLARKLSIMHLFTVGFPAASGGMERWCDGPGSVVVNNITYGPAHFLVKHTLSETKGEEDRARESYVMVLADKNPTTEMRHKFISNGWTGITLDVKMMINNDPALVLDLYKGVCSSVSLDANENEHYLYARFVGELVQIDGTSQMLLTKGQQKKRDPNDTSLDYVGDVLQLEWGGNS